MNAEQRARELLAEEYERERMTLGAADIRAGVLLTSEQLALRAIARALTRPAPTEAEVEAAANAIFDFAADPRAPGWEDVSHDTRDYYRCMARAALGVGDTGPT